MSSYIQRINALFPAVSWSPGTEKDPGAGRQLEAIATLEAKLAEGPDKDVESKLKEAIAAAKLFIVADVEKSMRELQHRDADLLASVESYRPRIEKAREALQALERQQAAAMAHRSSASLAVRRLQKSLGYFVAEEEKPAVFKEVSLPGTRQRPICQVIQMHRQEA